MPDPSVLIHPDDMLRYGLMAVKVDAEMQSYRCEQSNVEQFKSIFGKHPKHLARVWRDLQSFGLMDVEDLGLDLSFKGFLLGNNYLKTACTLNMQMALFKMRNKNKVGSLRWTFIEMIHALKEHKIEMPSQAEWDAVKILLSVDGTHARTNEPRDDEMRRNPKNFSFKNNFAGLNYQIALHIFKDKIAYVNTGDPASVHDMTAMRDEFIGLLPDGARVVADAGYTGKTEAEKRLFAVANPFDTDVTKTFKKRAKSRQETINKRIKDYKCMKETWSDGIGRHRIAFTACLVLVQYAIEDTSSTGEPIFAI